MTIMNDILPAVSELTESIDWFYILKTALLIAAAVCILGGVLRLIFGKDSSLVRAVSACINLVMIYLTGIILYVLIPQVRGSVASLPFITVTEEAFFLWDIRAMDSSSLCPALLQLFMLAFLVNLMESLLPHGQKLLSWYGFRLLTVFSTLGIYATVSSMIRMFIPQVYGAWAGYVLLGLWVFIGLTGLLKIILTVVLTVMNPIIGGIYSFFFSNIIGKQFSKAIGTTLLSVGVLMMLYRLGFVAFSFSSFSLASYGPACLITLLALYLFGKLL